MDHTLYMASSPDVHLCINIHEWEYNSTTVGSICTCIAAKIVARPPSSTIRWHTPLWRAASAARQVHPCDRIQSSERRLHPFHEIQIRDSDR